MSLRWPERSSRFFAPRRHQMPPRSADGPTADCTENAPADPARRETCLPAFRRADPISKIDPQYYNFALYLWESSRYNDKGWPLCAPPEATPRPPAHPHPDRPSSPPETAARRTQDIHAPFYRGSREAPEGRAGEPPGVCLDGKPKPRGVF